jgi:predicted  nucleic acid-binding Zn ribbon protein
VVTVTVVTVLVVTVVTVVAVMTAVPSTSHEKTVAVWLYFSILIVCPRSQSGDSSAPLPVFRARKGSVVFKCTDINQNQSWQHDCNYDISKVEQDHFNVRLVFHDRKSQNTLTLGMRRQPRV